MSVRALLAAVLLVLGAACGDEGGARSSSASSGGSGSSVTLEQWFQAHQDVRLSWNDVVNGGDTGESAEGCAKAKDLFDSRREVLLSPPDEELRRLVPPWADLTQRYYEACLDGDVEERRSLVMKTVDAGEPVIARMRQLGASV